MMDNANIFCCRTAERILFMNPTEELHGIACCVAHFYIWLIFQHEEKHKYNNKTIVIKF